MTHSAWWLIINALAAFRITHLLVKDSILDIPRDRLKRRAELIAFDHATSHGNHPTPIDSNWRGKLLLFITCPWCVGVWISGGVTLACFLVPTIWQYPAYAAALAAIVGLLSEHS